MAEDLMTDDEQLESLKRFVAENGAWIVGGLVIGALLLLGWRYYESQKNQQAMNAAAKFDALGDAVQNGDQSKARALVAELTKDYSSTPYADQADLMVARLAVDAGELANAVDPLTRVMDHSADPELRSIARLRLARVRIDQGKSEEALRLLATPSGAFSGRFHEVRGDAYYAGKDTAAAIKEYQAALLDPDARGVERQLIELKIADLGGSDGATPDHPAPTVVH